MKLILPTLFVVAMVSLSSCGSNENKAESTNAAPDTVVNMNPTVQQRDSAVLSDDSATVKTVKDVKDEEANAIKKEKADAEKLKEDKKK
ncbi:MAG: hypothetical protein IT249_01050 [Chitinophagaceae bacterium]|nr:hypothetical protein [Chitinophagaceae bacterium]